MKILLLLSFLYLCDARQFQFINRYPYDIWVGNLGNHGVKLKNNKDFPPLNGGGWIMKPGQHYSVNAPDDWEGRFWGRTGCNPQSKHCVTGDCGNRIQCQGAGGVPPVTLAEITLQGHSGLDFYDISLVDGFNIKMGIEPVNPTRGSCQKSYCYNDAILSQCPNDLRQNDNGRVVACASACQKYNTDQYCCRGAFNNPNVCQSSTYSTYFKQRCPLAYSFAYNDKSSTFTCVAPIYLITFG